MTLLNAVGHYLRFQLGRVFEMSKQKRKRTVPSYRKHKASGQAVVAFGGVDHYLGPHGSDASINEYDRLIAEFLAGGRNVDKMNLHANYCIAHLLARFWDYAKTYYVKKGKPTSEQCAYKQVIRSIRRLYGTTPIEQFGPLALKACRQVWLDAGLSRSSINHNQRRAVRIFRWGVSEEIVRPDVWQALTAVEGLRKGRTSAPEAKPIPPVDMQTVKATMEFLSPVHRDMIRMQLLTGMRPGEVCMLRPIDIDRSRDVWEYHPDGHKTEHHGRTRIVYIGPQAIVVLSSYMLRDPEAHCFSAAESMEWHRTLRAQNRKTPASCGNARGRKSDRKKRKKNPRRARTFFDTGSYGSAIKTACRKAWPAPDVIKDDPAAVKAWDSDHAWAPNRIRHTRATEIRRLYGLEAAQVILGHATADVTQIYAERDAEKAREIVLQIG